MRQWGSNCDSNWNWNWNWKTYTLPQLRTLIIFASKILSTTNSYDNFASPPPAGHVGSATGTRRGQARPGQARPDQARPEPCKGSGYLGKYLMWPGVLQVISLMMLHRCGIILFAVPQFSSAAPIPDDNLCKICICTRVCVCQCVCVCAVSSLDSRFSCNFASFGGGAACILPASLLLVSG